MASKQFKVPLFIHPWPTSMRDDKATFSRHLWRIDEAAAICIVIVPVAWCTGYVGASWIPAIVPLCSLPTRPFYRPQGHARGAAHQQILGCTGERRQWPVHGDQAHSLPRLQADKASFSPYCSTGANRESKNLLLTLTTPKIGVRCLSYKHWAMLCLVGMAGFQTQACTRADLFTMHVMHRCINVTMLNEDLSTSQHCPSGCSRIRNSEREFTMHGCLGRDARVNGVACLIVARR